MNRFLTAKRHQVDTREISQRTFDDYYATCERIVGVFGRTRLVTDLASDDFERLRAAIAAKWGPVAVGNEVQRVRVVFKYGFDAGLIDRPVRFGPTFKRPSKKVLRREQAAKGPKLFTPEQLQTLLASAGQQMRAMILLGINCGFGNADVGHLPIRSLDLERGWVDFPRPKTGIERRCPLWPETVAAIKLALSTKPEPKDQCHQSLLFITKYGDAWTKETRDSPVSKEFTKLLKTNKLHRAGLGFYALRHNFATIAGESRDQVAVNHIMGHADASMAAVYRERISDERLQHVVNFVRAWLFTTNEP
jgi:integrase